MYCRGFWINETCMAPSPNLLFALNYSNVSKKKKINLINWFSNIPPCSRSWKWLFLGRQAGFSYTANLKKKKTQPIKTVGSSSGKYHLVCVCVLKIARKRRDYISAHFILHPIPGQFVRPSVGCSWQAIYYIWFVLFPLVWRLFFFFLHLSQYLSLNEIGYGNVESCGRVVSADVVEPGRVETGTYSSEKQTVADADTSLQAGHIKPETRACTLQRYYSGNKHILEIKRRKQYGEKEGECLQSWQCVINGYF